MALDVERAARARDLGKGRSGSFARRNAAAGRAASRRGRDAGARHVLEDALDRAAASAPNPGRVTRSIASIAPSTPTRSAILPGRRRRRARCCPPTTPTATASTTSPTCCRCRRRCSSATCRRRGRSAALAVGDPAMRPAVETYKSAGDADAGRAALRAKTCRSARAAASPSATTFPLDGEYVIKVRLQRQLLRLHPRPRRAARARGAARRRARQDVHRRRRGRRDAAAAELRREHSGDRPTWETVRARAPTTASKSRVPGQGRHARRRRVVRVDGRREPEGDPSAAADRIRSRVDADSSTAIRPIDSITIGGPYDGRADRRHAEPPPDLRLPPPDSSARRGACARNDPRRRSRAARTAGRSPSRRSRRCSAFYRRPAAATAASTPASSSRSSGCSPSPKFLFRIERDPADVAAGRARIASATSSWRRGCRSSCGAAFPTTSCSTLAAHGQAERRRRCSSSRCGGCWPIRGRARSSTTSPASGCSCATCATRHARSATLSRTSTTTCAQAFQRETELFFESQLREDRSVVDLLTAELHVRQRAAGAALRHPERLRQPVPPRDAAPTTRARRPARPGQHPDGDVVPEPHVAGAARQVDAREHARHAAAAAAAERAGAQGATATAASRASMRERMEQHRANPACASCHALMDPLGFALENFDAHRQVADGRRGRQRRSTRRARCPTARQFEGLAGLRALCSATARASSDVHREAADLRARPRARSLRHAQRSAQIRTRGRRHDYRWSSLIISASSRARRSR